MWSSSPAVDFSSPLSYPSSPPLSIRPPATLSPSWAPCSILLSPSLPSPCRWSLNQGPRPRRRISLLPAPFLLSFFPDFPIVISANEDGRNNFQAGCIKLFHGRNRWAEVSQPRVVTRLYSSAESNYRAVRWKFAAVGYFAERRETPPTSPSPPPRLMGGKIRDGNCEKFYFPDYSSGVFLPIFRRPSNLSPLTANSLSFRSYFFPPFSPLFEK